MPVKMILAVAVMVAAFLTAACGDMRPDPPPNAAPSTPLAQLPVNVAFQQAAPTPTLIPQAVIDAADAEYLLLTNLYERVAPSVVNIEVVVRTANVARADLASGSGFVYDASGHIITNAHVVNNAADVQVTFNDGYVTSARIVGVDTYSDLAVIKVETDAARLRPVVFADSTAVRVGERAIAIGNPFGLRSSMTLGIISGLGRQLPSAELIDVDGPLGYNNPSIIQVDAEINPGNSGGPLLNSHGEVVGVNAAISTETGVFGGVGFAVPSRTVLRVVPELIEKGRVDYAWVGISSLSGENGYGVAALAEPLRLPVTSGVLIDTITPDSPAADAGLLGGSRLVQVRGSSLCAGGDIIVAINGQYVNSMDELLAYLVTYSQPGDVVNVRIVRGSETFDVPLTLKARPANTSTPGCGG